MMAAACSRDDFSVSPGWRRMQWAVTGPEGGTRSEGRCCLVMVDGDGCA